MSSAQSTRTSDANKYCMPHDRLGETIISRSRLEQTLLPLGEFVQRMYGGDPRKPYYPFDTADGIAIFMGKKRVCVLSPTLDVVHVPDGFSLRQGYYVGTRELVQAVERNLAEMSEIAVKIRNRLGGDA